MSICQKETSPPIVSSARTTISIKHDQIMNPEFDRQVETFRALTSDLAKPAELFPEIYQDWGDDEAYSLKLGRGECAA